jgi:hypothetical protein
VENSPQCPKAEAGSRSDGKDLEFLEPHPGQRPDIGETSIDQGGAHATTEGSPATRAVQVLQRRHQTC